MLINGEWIETSADKLVSVNPATGAVNHEISTADRSHVEAAVDAAKEAAAKPAWRNMLPHQRAAILHKIADRMNANADKFARLQMLENGKVWSECVAQVAGAASTFRYFAGVCESLGSEVTPSRGNYLSMTVYEPYGVVAAITPWNSPMTMEAVSYTHLTLPTNREV